MKKRFLLIAFLFLFLSACSGDKGAELVETAKFEELQNNYKHAKSLYEEVIRDYPNGESAKEAKERLKKINNMMSKSANP